MKKLLCALLCLTMLLPACAMADEVVRIPMAAGVDSLNAATACAVALAAMVRPINQ